MTSKERLFRKNVLKESKKRKYLIFVTSFYDWLE
jgi:hypothetical protein